MSLIRSSLQRIIGNNVSCLKKCNLCTTKVVNGLLYEKHPKSGYASPTKNKIPKIDDIRNGLKELKQEVKLWTDEMKERFQMDPLFIYRPGETDVVWDFQSKESLNQWILTSDRDHNEGYSTCSLDINRHGKAVFSGVLNTKIPKDGKIQRSGYCNMKSVRARKSFKRDSYYNWVNYNVLVMRVRGDGRSYALNLSTTGYFDLLWNDMYHYILFTRGGPYWQISKIPFSKFFFSSKGRVQDSQAPIPLEYVTNFGITVADKVNGSFNLEIDYIGLEFDPNLTEEFAYEMYKTDKNIASH